MPFFCHVDLLAARNLIPADADGLADPYYELWIEKHRVQSPDPARRSLNPNFMHRVVVGPIDLEVDVHGEIQHLPPVILRILDKDTEMLSSSFTVLGAAVVTNIHMFGREGPLKLNLLHQPSWYSLMGDACVPFSAGLIGDWIHAPRILMSLGMSSTREVQRFPGTEEIFSNSSATIETLNAGEWQHYEITISLLGLRDVTSGFGQFGGKWGRHVVEMSRFWSSGCIELELDDDGNFGDRKDTSDTCGCLQNTSSTLPSGRPFFRYVCDLPRPGVLSVAVSAIERIQGAIGQFLFRAPLELWAFAEPGVKSNFGCSSIRDQQRLG